MAKKVGGGNTYNGKLPKKTRQGMNLKTQTTHNFQSKTKVYQKI